MHGGVESREVTYTDLAAQVSELRANLDEINEISRRIKNRLTGQSRIAEPQPTSLERDHPIKGVLPSLSHKVGGMASITVDIIGTLQDVIRMLDDGKDSPRAN